MSRRCSSDASGTGSVPGADALSVRLGLRRSGLRRNGRPAEYVSAAGAQAFHLAWRAVESGLHDLVLCVGAERLAPCGEGAQERAAAARRYMAAVRRDGRAARQGAPRRTTARAPRNPAACAAGAVSPQAVLESDLVASPLTRLMIAPRTGRRRGRRPRLAAPRPRPARPAPRVRASVLARDGDEARAAQLAYAAAALGPEDVDCAEVHDETAAAELAAYEALQFVPDGEGPALVDTRLHRARRRPAGQHERWVAARSASSAGPPAIAQVCELAAQLAGAAGARQVPGARVGLAHSRGPGEDGGRLVALTLLSSA